MTTRDVALYRPFREALNNPSHVIGLPTLMWHLMLRKIQVGRVDPVSGSICLFLCSILILEYASPQLENARAAVDLYRSALNECEEAINAGKWPFELPPTNFARCYL